MAFIGSQPNRPYNDKVANTFNTPDQAEQRLVFLENQNRTLNFTLKPYFLQGRLRTDRTSPTSSADVQPPDQLYDRVVDASYEYILINNSGTLEWRRVAISVF